jgi:hypothetical protein
MSGITVQVIEIAPGLEGLEPEWQRLMERSSGATPFQSRMAASMVALFRAGRIVHHWFPIER